MSARAYTMKEMRAIVDYLVERKAFSEIRGRKMWIDYASSGLTTRTWQSLKETFLKRILPDIHNPYYKLSPETIRSFREGKDVANKIKNKLQFRNSADQEQVKPSTSANVGENGSGEDKIHSNFTSDRESTETIILKSTEEEIPENSDDQDDDNQNANTRTKSLRDCITFTEPLTPMLQEILHDFDSEEEDVVTGNDSLEERLQELTGEKPNKEVKNSVNDKKIVQPAESLNDTEREPATPERLNDKDKDQATKSTNNSPKPSKTPITITVTTANISPSKADKSPGKTEKATIELRSKTKKSDEDIVIVSDDLHKKKETKVNEVNPIPDTSVQIQKKNLRTQKSSQILVESQSTASASPSHKSEINRSVPDSLLPNNQEGLLNTLNGTDDSEHKATADAPQNSKEKAKLSPKPQEKSTTSPKAQEKNKKKFKTTLKKKTDTTEPTENAEPDKEQEVAEPEDSQMEEADAIIIIDSENNSNAVTSNEKVENDIPNNIDESEPKISEKTTTKAIQEKENVKQVDVAKEKADDLAIEVQASQSQPLSNPCLQSVSLYEENLPENSSNDSDLLLSEHFRRNSFKQKVVEHDKDVLILGSNSNSEVESALIPPLSTNFKPRRKRILNNLFAKNKDAVKHKRRRYNSHLRDAPQVTQLSSDSSSWSSTDTDDCAFVSPPRAKGRYSKKYLKPVPSRLLSLEQKGGLFVACGKKIYPLIDSVKGPKTYLSYIPEENSDDDEAEYWKLKYVEERKKNADLTKLLELQNNRTSRKFSLLPNSPILPSKSVKNNNATVDNNHDDDDDDNEEPKIIVAKQVEKPIDTKEEKTVKIKYAKNNEEISLEGEWLDVRVILQDVMQIIKRDRPGDDVIIPQQEKGTEQAPVIISGSTTPDEESHRNVAKLEDSIMQETEERDNIEENGEEKPVVTNNKRRGRPKKRQAQELSPQPPQPPVAPKTRRSRQKLTAANVDNKSDTEIIVNESKLKPNEAEVASSPSVKSGRRRRAASAKPETTKQKEPVKVLKDDDSEILYKFPSPTRSTPTRELINIDENYKNTKKPSSLLRQPVPLSPESTLGYQDSDGGPAVEILKKKKPLSTVGHRNKSRRNLVRKPYELSNSDASNECSISLPSAPQKPTKQQAPENDSQNTEAYRSESYQMLMPKTKYLNEEMDQIQESSPCPNEMNSVADTNSLHLSPASQHMDSRQDKSSSSISIHLNTEPASSSSVSLPLSPELSIVENISLSKSNLNIICDQPTINEIQANEDSLSLTCDKFALSQVDVTMPLMEQECQLRKSHTKNSFSETIYEQTSEKTFDVTIVEERAENFDLDINSNKRGNTVSDTLLDKLDTVSIEDKASFANSLDDHMKNLLLESAKKAKPNRKSMREKENVVFDQVMEVDQAEADKNKTKQKKRCSTPRKRQNIIKSQQILVDGVIEEETMESCASGRKSCPAVFSTIDDEITINISDKSKSPNNVTVRKPKKTKQIIRVKILRPKPKKSLNNVSKTDSGRTSKQSVRTDSEINATTSSHSLNLNETVEFIHNHSETCLQASECLDSDSLQILSPSRSIISLTTSSLELDDGLDKVSTMSQESSGMPPEMYCSDARDGSVAMKVNTESKRPSQNTNSPNECYHTPPASVSSLASIITEDLSDEIPSKRLPEWYLVSDEDATNTLSNLAPAPNTVDNSLYNAYLKRLFPVTYAVPDLSTITEASKDNDSQGRQNPKNTAEYDVNNLLCSERLSDDDFLSCQS